MTCGGRICPKAIDLFCKRSCNITKDIEEEEEEERRRRRRRGSFFKRAIDPRAKCQ
jgi:hypothetical protein